MRISAAIILLIIIQATGAFSNNPDSVDNFDSALKKAEEFIAERKYYSAFKLLYEVDPSHASKKIFLFKSHVALNYAARSFMHHSFAFADLRDDQTLDDARAADASINFFDFQIDKVLDKFLAMSPGDPELNILKGELYYEIYSLYGSRWFLKKEKLLSLSEEGFRNARASGTEDCKILLRMGAIREARGDIATAARFFSNAFERNRECVEAVYRHAFLDFNRQRYTTALAGSLEAFALFKTDKEKSEASYLTALIFDAMGDRQSALKYASGAYSLNPANMKFSQGLLILHIKESQFLEAADRAEKILNSDISNSYILREIIEIYCSAGKKSEALSLLNDMEKRNSGNFRVLGHISFARAYYYSAFTGNDRNRRIHLNRARENYRRVYSGTHQIFSLIERELNEK